MNSSYVAQNSARDVKSQPNGEWQSIETAGLGKRALFWNPVWISPAVGTKAGDRLVTLIGVSLPHVATHWMPLPEPPRPEGPGRE